MTSEYWWKRFEATGKIEDYLSYRQTAGRAGYDAEDLYEDDDEWSGDMGEPDRGGGSGYYTDDSYRGHHGIR